MPKSIKLVPRLVFKLVIKVVPKPIDLVPKFVLELVTKLELRLVI